MTNHSQAGDVDEWRSMKISPLSCLKLNIFRYIPVNKKEQSTLEKATSKKQVAGIKEQIEKNKHNNQGEGIYL